jgi:hypothetical protein
MIKQVFICLIVLMSSCTPSKTQNKMNVELEILPSGGGEKGYSIAISNDTLQSKKRAIGSIEGSIALTDIKEKKELLLNSTQKDSVIAILGKINLDIKSNEAPFALDTWMYTLKVDGKEVAKFNSMTILQVTDNEQLEICKKLIKRLINMSPLKIDLQSFS